MDIKTFKQQYEVSLFFVNSQQNVGLYQLLNILQDAAFRHAMVTKYQQSPNVYWVLTRQSLQVTRWPRLGDHIEVQTWLSTDERGFLLREYKVYLNEEVVCECSTSVAKLDVKAKKILAISQDDVLKYTTEKQLSFTPKKVQRFTEAELLKTFSVRNSDIDFNQHVNNTVYAKWILDAVSYDKHFKYKLLSYEVNFLCETHLGEEIQIQKDSTVGEPKFVYQGVRLSDNKIVLTVEIEAVPK
ncbi:acyl-[acyl-carrier-protein] thioesterase [Candidatus Uabimicrobium amorphum]|uniref:Acyl-ACP thioesterase n=1 Tax=Uabimicrobium amorphum TaxID=2596890 RepID=A0A5S9ILV7_UABAM|nr:acyl-ACP thioesterase domain-containing protein [Candidatus Uabimicrobium amorphum]BBM83430.1 acyl-ACP thioesterase [Candidatus Uabimicrobium amorphum]